MINTKLLKPDTNTGIIPRQRLLERFTKAKNANLVLVVAPAGFGKSIAISQWIDSVNEPFGWLSLDEEDDNLQSFLSYFIASIKSVSPKVSLIAEQLLFNMDNPGIKVITDTLLNDLEGFENNITLVLDDFHLITNAEIHKLINQLVHYTRPNIRFILSSRNLPPLQTAKFRMQSKLAEITIDDLQFDSSELNLLLDEKRMSDLSHNKKQSILAFSEGWIVGLHIILKDLKDYGAPSIGLDGAKRAKEQIFDIFLEDVFHHQTLFIQQQLVLSAHLNRFSKDLLNYVTAACLKESIPNAERIDFIRFLQRSNLFLLDLDTDKEWFRYHHLFQEFLIKRTNYVLDQEKLNCFFDAAATWYSKLGFFEEALKFALKCNDLSKAIEVFSTHRINLIDKEQFSRLLGCLKLFPVQVIENNPILVLSRALLADSKANYVDMASDLAIAQQLLSKNASNKALEGEIYALTACAKYLTGEVEEALSFAKQALDLLPPTAGYIRDFATAYSAMASFSVHSVKESIALIDDARSKLTSYNVFGETRLLSIKSILHAIEANYDDLEDTSSGYLHLSKQNNLMMSWVMASYFLGSVYYKGNHLNKAKKHLKAVAEAKFFGRPYWNLCCSKVYLDTLVALGEFDECCIHLNELDQWVGERNDPGLNQFVLAIKTEVALLMGDLKKAKELAKKFDLSNFPIVPFYTYVPQLTLPKVHLYTNRIEDWEVAKKELDQLYTLAQSLSYNTLLAEILALKAVYYQRVGDLKKSQECLLESIDAVKGGSNIRTYADLGSLLHPTIRTFTEQFAHSESLLEVIAFFEQHDFTKTGSTMNNLESKPNISVREIEIIRLISQGLRNSEIAEVLHVSEDTVKKHLYNAYKKLGVRNRIGAVQRAEKLSIL